MKKLIFALVVLVSGTISLASTPTRVKVASHDNVRLDTFIYSPENLSLAKGVVLSIGGSGLTRGGFGGPAGFSRNFAASGYVGIEWNKRGIQTSDDLTSTAVDFVTYNSATIENIFLDAASVVEYAEKAFPTLPIFVVGGSEGSVTTTLLAQYYGKKITAVSTFGNVVMPFIQTSSMQIADLFLKGNWKLLDSNNSNEISPDELLNFKTDTEEFKFLTTTPFARIDQSNDGSISLDEMTAYFVDYFVNEHPNKNYWYESSGVSNQYLESMYRLEPLTTRVYDIFIPVFMAQGEIDWNTPAKNVFDFQIQCKKTRVSNFTFKYYPKVGHAPSPEMFGDILAFFDSFVPAPLR